MLNDENDHKKKCMSILMATHHRTLAEDCSGRNQ